MPRKMTRRITMAAETDRKPEEMQGAAQGLTRR
jgi:hypothetical protein